MARLSNYERCVNFAAVMLCLVSVTSGWSIASRHEDTLKDCEWQRTLPEDDGIGGEDEGLSASVILACRLRTIGGTESVLGNLTSTQVERITTLRLECSDVLFFESSLENSKQGGSFLGQLRRLRDLRIEYCKIRTVPAAVLASLRELRRLTLRTHNTDWSAMTMEFHPDSFRGLTELRSLDLADNNIWTLPQELFCPLYSLSRLNLSRNKLQDVAELGFSDWGNGPSAPGKSCNSGLEELDMSANDISTMPDNGLTSLRSLQKLYLQDNSITSLEDRAFVGLSALQIVNVSSNQLVALPPELFHSTRNIREVYLQNNSISVLAPGLLEGLDQLQVLDLSHNDLNSNWVNRDTFSGLVRLVVLNLGHNSITRIDSHVFHDLYSLQILNLEHNNIELIAEGSFSALSNLHALILSHNNLIQVEPYHFAGLYVLDQLFLGSNNIHAVHPRAFENCTHLQDLDLSGNVLTHVPEGLNKLHFLKTLDLGVNKITKIANNTFEGLDQLYGLRLIENELTNVTREVFSSLLSLQVLNLACNKIQQVDSAAFGSHPTLRAIRLDGNKLTDINNLFSSLPGLVWLNISDNNLEWFDYKVLPHSLEWLDMHKNYVVELGDYYNMRNELQIKMLDASFNKLTEIGPTTLPDSVESVFLNDNHIRSVQANTFLKKSNLSRVVLYANEIKKLDLAALRLEPVPPEKELPQFFVGGNPFHCDCTMEWLQRINQLSHVRQHPRVLDLDSVTCQLTHTRGEVSRPLLDLKPSQFLCPYETHCFALCHCCDFDACDCEMTCPENCSCYHDHTWASNVVDCSHGGHKVVPSRIPMDATEIYLDGNDLGELGSHVFIGKKKLQVLYLNDSNIIALHNRTFNGVTGLRILHLENNNIEELRGFEFDQLENLNELYLDHNAITHVANTTFTTMDGLQVLSLDGNKITNFSPWELLPPASESVVRVSLEGNTWNCDCESATRFEQWLRDNKKTAAITDPEKMTCSDGRREKFGDVIRRCSKTSESAVATSVVQRNPFFNNTIMGDNYIPFIAGSVVIVIVIFGMSALVYIFRHDVRLWAHSHYGIRIFKQSPVEVDHDRERLYDGYMVYSVKDEDFVSRVIASELEQGGYSLCLHYRDLHLASGAAYLADSVLAASDVSRRLLVVLSLSFLQHECDRPEFRNALHTALEQRPGKVIFVVTTDLTALNLEPDLQRLLRECTVVAWGERRFWDKLRFAMPDLAPVKKKKMPPPSTAVAVNDLKKNGGEARAKSNRYTAAPTYLDSWYKYAVMAPASAPNGVPTPTPTQSTYVSENSSQRTTDHEEEEESSSSQHYEYADRPPRRHVYSTIPDSLPLTHHSRSSTSSGEPPAPANGRTYFV